MARTFTRADVGDNKWSGGKKVMLTARQRDKIAAEQTATALLRETKQVAIDKEKKIQERIVLDARTKAIAGLEADGKI